MNNEKPLVIHVNAWDAPTFEVGDRVGIREGTCFGKVAAVSHGCCGLTRVCVDLLCQHGDDHPTQIWCNGDELEHVD